jgi:hypothetical protein
MAAADRQSRRACIWPSFMHSFLATSSSKTRTVVALLATSACRVAADRFSLLAVHGRRRVLHLCSPSRTE